MKRKPPDKTPASPRFIEAIALESRVLFSTNPASFVAGPGSGLDPALFDGDGTASIQLVQAAPSNRDAHQERADAAGTVDAEGQHLEIRMEQQLEDLARLMDEAQIVPYRSMQDDPTSWLTTELDAPAAPLPNPQIVGTNTNLDLIQFTTDTGHVVGFEDDSILIAAPSHLLQFDLVGANLIGPVAADGSTFTNVTYVNAWDGVTAVL